MDSYIEVSRRVGVYLISRERSASEAVHGVSHFHTATCPVPSPVKKSPPGPDWILPTFCLPNIVPLLVNLHQQTDHIGLNWINYDYMRMWKTSILIYRQCTHDGNSYNMTESSLQEQHNMGLSYASCIPNSARIGCNKKIFIDKIWYIQILIKFKLHQKHHWPF